MKKNIVLAISMVMLFVCITGCNNSHKYTVYGELPMEEFEGATVYLNIIDNGTTIDSTVVENGKFSFSGILDKPMMATLVTLSETSGIECESVLVLEHGKIHIDMTTDSLYGTPLNETLYKTYTADSLSLVYRRKIENCVVKYSTAPTPQQKEEARKECDKLLEQVTSHTIDLSREVYSNNLDNVLGAYALHMIVENDGISFDSLDRILQNAGPIFADYEPLRKARTQLFHLANTAEGKPYVDFIGTDPKTGEETHLSDLISNKQITLVDFWASWCSPCRQEISRNLNNIYAKYQKKGVNIIGVDVWDTPEKHKAAVAELEVKYPQIIDTVGTSAEIYGVTGIPSIILIDKEGTIVRRDLRGEQIEAAVLQALAE